MENKKTFWLWKVDPIIGTMVIALLIWVIWSTIYTITISIDNFGLINTIIGSVSILIFFLFTWFWGKKNCEYLGKEW